MIVHVFAGGAAAHDCWDAAAMHDGVGVCALNGGQRRLRQQTILHKLAYMLGKSHTLCLMKVL